MRRLVQFGATFLGALAAAQTFQDQAFSVHPVTGSSMYPTLNSGRRDADSVLVQRWAYDGAVATRGDIVAVQSPEATPSVLIKRIVGLPGDVVKLRHGVGMQQVPEGHCWLQGDNKATSRDSDAFGPVPLALVLGKALVRFPYLMLWKAEELSHEVDPSAFVYSSEPCLQERLDVHFSPRTPPSDAELESALDTLERLPEEDGRCLGEIVSDVHI